MSDRFFHFEISNLLPHFPRPVAMAVETRFSPAYHWRGQDRRGQNHCIFQYTYEGRGVFVDGNRKYDLTAGCGFLCEAKDPAIAYYYPEGTRTPWRFVWLAFAGIGVFDQVHDLTQRHGPVFTLPENIGIIKRLLGLRLAGSPVLPDANTTTGTAGKKALPYVTGVFHLHSSAGAELVMELLCTLAESKESGSSLSAEERLVQEVKREIDRQSDCRVNVATLGRELKVSREHLTRVFKHQTGVTPYQYILRRQILHACQLLSDPTLPVKEVATRLGFDNTANFIRTFRGVVGMPPNRFRENGTVPVLF